MRRPPLTATLGLALTLGCAELPDLSSARCGDGFVDLDREDCDGETHDIGGESYRCDRQLCRITCEAEDTGACPPGWGCDGDRICHQPTGEFEQIGVTVTQGAARLEIADFTGDGRMDVATLGGELGIYVLVNGAVSRTYSSATSSADAAIGQLTAGVTADIALPTSFGLGVLRGRSTGALDPMVYPSSSAPDTARFFALDAMPVPEGASAMERRKWSGDEILIVSQGKIFDGQSRFAVAGVPMVGGKKLAREIPAARLDDATACDQLVLSYEDTAEVHIYGFCKKEIDGTYVWQPRRLTTVTLPEPWQIDGGVFIEDLNDDGRPDLLILVKHSVGAGALGLLQSLLVGSFASGDLFSPPATFQSTFTGVSTPLAVGHLDGDGAVDIVTADGIYLSRQGSSVIRYADLDLGLQQRATAARIADMNGDGRPDVVVAFDVPASLVFFNNAGSDGDPGVLNPALLALGGAPSHLTLGDFDGDLVNDVAFAESLPAGSSTAESEAAASLAVAFGRHGGAPDARVKVAGFNSLTTVLGGRDVAPIGPIGDAMTDLMVVRTPLSQRSSLSFFPATSDRRLGSPFLFSAPRHMILPSTVSQVPTQVAIGRFASHSDGIAALTRGSGDTKERFLWRLPVAGEADIAFPAPSVPLPGGFHWDSARMVAIDHDPALETKLDRLAILVTRADQASSALLVTRVGPDEMWVIEEEVQLQQKSWRSIRAEDMDGDGRRDIVALAGADGGLHVFLDRGGRFSSGALVQGIGGPITAFACAKVDSSTAYQGRSPREIVVLTRSARHVARYAPAIEGFIAASIGESGGGDAISAGDLDGDGLDDLAVLAGDTLTLLRSTSRLPR